MAVTFDDARLIADRECRDRFTEMLAGRGTFHVADWGFEDDDSFSMIVGAWEAIVDGDDSYQVFDAPRVLVDKNTGELSEVNYLMNRARLREMTPVGPVPPDSL